MPDDLRERVAVLESQMIGIKEGVTQMADDIRTIRELIASAKGVRWVIAGLAGLVIGGGFVGAIVHKLWP